MDVVNDKQQAYLSPTGAPQTNTKENESVYHSQCVFDQHAVYRARPKRVQLSVSVCPRMARALTSAHLNVSKFVASKLKASLNELGIYPIPGDDEVWGWRDVGEERQLISFKTAAAWGLWTGGPVPEDCESQKVTEHDKSGKLKRVVI